jgi:hypothetical protein
VKPRPRPTGWWRCDISPSPADISAPPAGTFAVILLFEGALPCCSDLLQAPHSMCVQSAHEVGRRRPFQPSERVR